MKFLVLIAVIVGVVWLLRSMRRPQLPPRPQNDAVQGAKEAKDPQAAHEDMVSCAQCGVHLPRSEALPGRGGVFCSEAHRAAFEAQRSH